MKHAILVLVLLLSSCVVEQRQGVVIDKIEEYDISSVGYGISTGDGAFSSINLNNATASKDYYAVLKDIENGSVHKKYQNLEESYTNNKGDTLNYKLYHFRWSKNGKRVRYLR